MKLKVSAPGAPGRYQGSLAPYRFTFTRWGRRGWHVTVTIGKEAWRLPHPATGLPSLRDAKAYTAQWWLNRKLVLVFRAVKSLRLPDGEIAAILKSAQQGEVAAIAAANDWLAERGLPYFREWIIEPGQKGKIDWPDGWRQAVPELEAASPARREPLGKEQP